MVTFYVKKYNLLLINVGIESMKVVIRFIIISLVLLQSIYCVADTKKKITLKPNNANSFNNYLKVLREMEFNSFLNGTSSFSITKVTPEEIVNNYKQDPEASDVIYKYKQVRIEGVISRLQQDTFKKYYFNASNPNSNELITIYLSPRDPQLYKYKGGEKIDIICYGIGMQYGRPTFENCQLPKSYINSRYAPIIRHSVSVVSKDYKPQSQKELNYIILYKSIENYIEKDCFESVEKCIDTTLMIIKGTSLEEALEEYKPIVDKYQDIPELPPYE